MPRKLNSLHEKDPPLAFIIIKLKSECFYSFLFVVSVTFPLCFKITRSIFSVQVLQFARNQNQILPFCFRCYLFEKLGQQFDLSN